MWLRTLLARQWAATGHRGRGPHVEPDARCNVVDAAAHNTWMHHKAGSLDVEHLSSPFVEFLEFICIIGQFHLVAGDYLFELRAPLGELTSLAIALVQHVKSHLDGR